MRYLCLWITCAWIACIGAQAQRIIDNRLIDQGRSRLELRLASLLADGLIDETTATLWQECYEELLASPLEINRAGVQDLLGVPLLSEYQAYQLVRYRTDRGRIASLYDLKAIEGWDDEAIVLFLPVLYCADEADTQPPSLTSVLERGQSQLDWLVQRPWRSERETARYIGSAESVMLGWQWRSSGHASAFVGAEKDSYEPWRRGGHRGADSYAGHVALYDVGVVRRLVLGDYRLGWGEGLVVRQGYRAGSLASPIAYSRAYVRPAFGTAEADKYRGLATELALGRWSCAFALSLRYVDGRVDETTKTITSLSEGGLHRTETEWARRHSVGLRSYGGRIGYEAGRLAVAIQWLRYDWGGYRLRTAPGATGAAALSGIEHHSNASLSYHYVNSRGNASIAGEVARSSLGAWAWVQRLGLESDRYGRWHLAVRYIAPDYWAYYGQSYTHYRRPHNEMGLSLGGEWSLWPRLSARAEADLYRSPTPRRGHAVGQGYRLRGEAMYEASGSSRLSLSWTHRRGIGQAEVGRLGLRYHYAHERIELIPTIGISRVWQQGQATSGYALGLRLHYRPTTWLRVRSSCAYYHTPSWEGRIYLSEPRLSRQYTSTFLYGRGYRLALAIDGQLSRSLSLGLQLVHHHRRAPHDSYSLGALQLSWR